MQPLTWGYATFLVFLGRTSKHWPWPIRHWLARRRMKRWQRETAAFGKKIGETIG